MPIIEVNKLRMEYKVRKKETGLKGSIKGLFSSDYSLVEAVRDISFKVEPGDFIGLVGPNGAGKTTVIKILSGILHPTSGEAKVMGYIPWERKKDFKMKFSIVMGQRSQLWWDLPAKETFLINKDIYDIPTDKYKERFNYLVDLLDVGSVLDVQVRRLSLGERMKMELIAAFLHFPKVIYLDEPTIGLDVLSQRRVREFLKKINQEDQVTILLTSHYMTDILELCEKMLIINKGDIIYNGFIQDIFKEYGKLKIIGFNMIQPAERKELESLGDFVSFEGNLVKYKVKNENIQQMCQSILSKYSVDDINIQETSMEDIMCEIFSNNQ